ncbi:MAG: DUF2652 domain-containing protein [Fulvivirga sp.]
MSPSVCVESDSVVNPALIMIPDISGFTEYMNNADLSHSQVRIASLLESILESNVLEFDVSEIEGDAILFYSLNNTSNPIDVIEQCELMFTNFHNKLREFEVLDCQCGSCQKLQELSLKFIVHWGMLGSVMVRDYCKLYGRDLIIAHRLLKNNLKSNEYILMTNDFVNHYMRKDMKDHFENHEWNQGTYDIPNIGELAFHFKILNSLTASISNKT